jgi:hypothetical protein
MTGKADLVGNKVLNASMAHLLAARLGFRPMNCFLNGFPCGIIV